MAVGIPVFRSDGYLPEGIHVCTEAEATFRFGSKNRRRRGLAIRIRRWCELARAVGALRLLLDGSYVTAKDEPEDVDAVMLLPHDFAAQVERGLDPAIELEEMFSTRQPEEMFAAEDDADWEAWCEFFSRTREPDGRRKGLVEIVL
jgi:hypothetical protein